MVVQRDRQATEEARPSAPNADTFDLPETPDSLAIEAITRAMSGDMPPGDEPDEPDEEGDEDDLEPDEEEVDDEDAEEDLEEDGEPTEDEERATEPQAKGKRSVDEWVDVLARDGVQRFSNVPRKLLHEVLPKYVERTQRQVVTDAATITAAQLEAQRQWIKWSLQMDKAFEDDPDAQLEWLKQGSPEAQAYTQWKSYMEREVSQEANLAAQQNAQLNQLMQKQVARLQDYPELQQELVQRHNANPYAASIYGLDRLTDDVVELLEKATEQKLAQRRSPAVKKAKERVANAQHRQSVPRPDVSRGRGNSPRQTPQVSDPNDPNEWLALGVSQAFEKMKR